MDLGEQLKQAAAESGIPELALAPGEACRVELEEGDEIYFELSSENDRLLLYAPLLTRLPETREKLWEEALTLNLFGNETGGATIAYDRGADELLLFLEVRENGKVIDFQQLTGTFLAALEHCRQHLENSNDQTPAGPSGESDNLRMNAIHLRA